MYRIFFCLTCLLLLHTAVGAQEKKYSFSRSKMGSPFNIIIVSNDPAKAETLSNRCYALVDSFTLIFSDYDPESELSRINRSSGKGEQPVSPGLLEILLRSQTAYRNSRQSFDISIGPLSLLWRRSRKEKIFPDSMAITRTRKLIGFSQVHIDSSRHTINLPVTGMRLDLGGIAKGYIAQKVIAFLEQEGIHKALADAGGDMAMSGAMQNSPGWVVGVNIPENTDKLLPRYLLLQSMAVATSGDAYQYIEHNGKKYSHIIDPQTGYGIQSQRNVTVIAGNGTDADWLATACSILPITEAKQVARRAGAELLITEIRHGKIVYFTTKGFGRYWRKA